MAYVLAQLGGIASELVGRAILGSKSVASAGAAQTAFNRSFATGRSL